MRLEQYLGLATTGVGGLLIQTLAFTAPAPYIKLPQINNVPSFIQFFTTWLPIKKQCYHSTFAMAYYRLLLSSINIAS